MELYPHITNHLSEVERIMACDLEKEDQRVFGLLLPFLRRGGKRIRPALSLLSCSATVGKYGDMLAPAAIIEMFHNFTLIHDDIEDDSKFRRGEPSATGYPSPSTRAMRCTPCSGSASSC